MTLEEFKKGFENNNSIKVSERYAIWDDYELEDLKNHKWTKYKSLEDLVSKNRDIGEIIAESDDFTIIDFSGGNYDE